ncbi:hypothetical protein [Bradyrhizobium sp. 2TAF24]|uniref:hypothetical protein n=1 Tax=Bradyrhizobium sp. 2TAF24 TaxID=3233011 RepID=UPI003F8FC513
MADSYAQRLARLDPAGFLLPPAARRLCLLTGQSDFTTSALPADKRAFLDAVAPADVVMTPVGFPWHADFAAPAAGAVPIALASLRNARQWLWARGHPVYRAGLAASVGTLLARTGRRLFLVTGSCGIDLLADALAHLPAQGPEIWAAVVGPAGRLPPAGRLAGMLVVQGRGDIWSRALWRGAVDVRPRCGHLDYYTDDATRAAIAAFFAGARR